MAQIVIVEYQHEWPAQYDGAAAELAAAFAPSAVRIEHIGSTSVSGLCAKPVLDILLGADALAEIESRIHALERLGYTYRPEYEAQLPERRYFVRAASVTPRVHLHAVHVGSPIFERHLLFRDLLRRNPTVRSQYAELKRKLAMEHMNNKAAYSEAKDPFIQRALAERLAGTADASRSAI
jgi:GrpB-like predicted nucleotidyltransferase (UPF0157 family)